MSLYDYLIFKVIIIRNGFFFSFFLNRVSLGQMNTYWADGSRTKHGPQPQAMLCGGRGPPVREQESLFCG